MNAKIVTIGDELLIGQVVDTNSAWLGEMLEKINIKVTEIRSIQDRGDTIISVLTEMIGNTDVVILTGGLGPTKDDVTKKALADFFGVGLVFHEESFSNLKRLLSKYNVDVKESHKSQAFVPANCQVLANKMGTAQGMWMEKDGTIVISTPGVPYEMKYIMETSGLEKLSLKNNSGKIFHKTVMTVGWGETRIEEEISDIIASLPNHVQVAYLPGLGNVRIRISSFSSESSEDDAAKYGQIIAERLGALVYGFDDIKLQDAVGEMLVAKKMKLGLAESCTGGYLSHLITSVPGSSRYFEGSIVAYSYDIKTRELNVQKSTLEEHGAVSEETVQEMVKGALKKFQVDVAIAISGIAGPGGGTPEKPVGTIWIACATRDLITTRKLQLSKNRTTNIKYTAIASLNMLRKILSDE